MYNNLFKILKASIYGGELDLSGACDYDSIFSELQSQTVLTLTKPVMNQLPLSAELHEKWEKAINQQLANNAKVSFEEKKICTLLKEANIPFVIIKGSAAAQYYPKPELRTKGDIDVLVLKEQYWAAENILKNNKYQKKAYVGCPPMHYEFFKNDVEVELHFCYIVNKDELLQKEIPNAVLKNGIPFFNDVFNGLVILYHIKKHLCEGGTGLRHFIDWCMFANVVCNDEFWETELKPLADEFGLTKLAKALTQLGINKGLIEKQYLWCSDVSNELCEEMLHYFLYCGNFNRKYPATNTKAVRVMKETNNAKDFKGYLEALGNAHSTKKDKFSIYSTGVKYLFKHAKSYISANNIKDFRQQKLEAERRKKLFKELGI